MVEKISFPNGLVNTSASWFAEATNLVVIDPSCILSRMKWQSISICLVLSWKTGLAVICKVALLSQCNNVGFECNIHKSFNNEHNQDNSQQVPVIARYSASTEESDTVFCLFVHQEISEDPKKTQYPVVDLLVIGQPAQSESQKARRDKSF